MAAELTGYPIDLHPGLRDRCPKGFTATKEPNGLLSTAQAEPDICSQQPGLLVADFFG